MSTYTAKSKGLAALLRYNLGPNAHLSTWKERNHSAFFTFQDEPPGTCEDLERSFHSGVITVENARLLLDAGFEVIRTVSLAIRNGGRWINERGSDE